MKLTQSKLPYYSGLMIKVGDTTTRPLASECLFVRIRRDEHPDLYQAFDEIRATVDDGKRVDRDSLVARYTTPHPPVAPYDPAAPGPEWKRVKFVRDFPALLNLTTMRGKEGSKFRLLREPLRTLDQNVIAVVGREKGMGLPPFRREGP